MQFKSLWRSSARTTAVYLSCAVRLELWRISAAQWDWNCGVSQLRSETGTMAYLSCAVRLELWRISAAQWDCNCGVSQLRSETGTVVYLRCAVRLELWCISAAQWDWNCGVSQLRSETGTWRLVDTTSYCRCADKENHENNYESRQSGQDSSSLSMRPPPDVTLSRLNSVDTPTHCSFKITFLYYPPIYA
jgi:hypothetical protein